MSVYIKGLEMPTNCNECRFFVDAWCYALEVDDWRNAYNKPLEGERLPGCPLIPVPDHGDLIDKSGVEVLSWTEGEYGSTFEDGVLFVLDKLDELPVIISAEGEDYEVPAEEHSPFYESLKRGLEQAINGESRSETVSAEEGE